MSQAFNLLTQALGLMVFGFIVFLMILGIASWIEQGFKYGGILINRIMKRMHR